LTGRLGVLDTDSPMTKATPSRQQAFTRIDELMESVVSPPLQPTVIWDDVLTHFLGERSSSFTHPVDVLEELLNISTPNNQEKELSSLMECCLRIVQSCTVSQCINAIHKALARGNDKTALWLACVMSRNEIETQDLQHFGYFLRKAYDSNDNVLSYMAMQGLVTMMMEKKNDEERILTIMDEFTKEMTFDVECMTCVMLERMMRLLL